MSFQNYYKANLRDLTFLLFEQFGLADLLGNGRLRQTQAGNQLPHRRFTCIGQQGHDFPPPRFGS